MSNKLLFPWIIVIQTIVLLVVIGVAYSSDNEAIESAVGPHLLHIVTISLLLITFINASKDARSYARIYAWTNVAMDNVALFLMLFRYSQTEKLNLGDRDAAHFTMYIVFVFILIVIDIHNVSFSWEIEDVAPKKLTTPRDETPSDTAGDTDIEVADPLPTQPKTDYQAAALWVPKKAPKLSIRALKVPANIGITRRQHPSLRFV